jgi:hypothetical protein
VVAALLPGRGEAVTAGRVKLAKCFWCWRRDCNASDWEQNHHAKGWQRLCVRCAGSRLMNPYNGLLDMRKITEAA